MTAHENTCPDCDVQMVAEKYDQPKRVGAGPLIRQRCPKCGRVEHPRKPG